MATRRRPSARRTPAYRSTAVLALVAMVLLGLNVPTSIIVVMADLSQLEMIDTLKTAREADPERPPMSDEELEAQDERTATAALIWLLVYVLTGIAFITWFRRMHTNLPALGATRLRFTSGWAVGCWFVPFLNLVRPYEIAQEIWAGSAPAAEPPPPPPDTAQLGGAELEEARVARRKERVHARQTAETSGLIKAWWGCWIGLNLLSVVANKMEGSALDSLSPMLTDAQYIDAMESLHSATQLVVLTDALDIPMAILAIYLVRTMNARQIELAADERLATSAARSPLDEIDDGMEP